MPIKLTEGQKRRYMERKGQLCPACLSKNIDARKFSLDGWWVTQEVVCLSCNHRWQDVYTLTGIQDTEE